MINDFLSIESVNKPGDFVGREKELRRIFNYLQGENPDNCSIIGEPRIGKSSFMNMIRFRKIGAVTGNNVFILIPLVMLPKFDSLTFWKFILSQLEIELDTTYHIQLGIGELDNVDLCYSHLSESIESLLTNYEFRKIIFIVDDLDLLFQDNGITLDDLAKLRALSHSYRNRLVYVFSSKDPLANLYYKKFDRTEISPFLTIFRTIELSLLDQAEAVELIEKAGFKSEVNISSADAKFILNLVGPHPDMLKLALSYLFEAKENNMNKNVDTDDFYRKLAASIVNDSKVHWLCNTLIERHNNYKQSLLDIANQKMPDINTTNRLREHYGLIVEVEGTYKLFSEAFMYWLSREYVQESKVIMYTPEKSQVEINGQLKMLSDTENRLFSYLYERANTVCAKENLLEEVWGGDRSPTVVEQGIRRLRDAIEPDPRKPKYILSRRGEGYWLKI